MGAQILNLPINIPWKQIAVSPDMMDTTFGNKRFPFEWRPSLAIAVHEPKLEELPEERCDERITYVKVTCTITGYQPSRLETQQGYASFPDVPTERLDHIFEEYFACYGVLLNIAVFPLPAGPGPHGPTVPLKDYPRIVGFEPKVRDFYQAATETGEVLTGSKSGVNTDKTLSHLESTEDSFGFGAKVPVGVAGELSGSISRTTTDTDQDSWTVQTDASRERRETRGTTTQLSQLYNLLTGYHQGTNRAAFLMLSRPHVLPPTDHRTFVQGLRYIEGVQEFMLVVARPKSVPGLCLEAFLETGHFPEDVDIAEPQAEYYENHEDFTAAAFVPDGWISGSCTNVESDPSAEYTIDSQWVIDRSKGDPGHGGIQELSNASNERANQTLESYDYRPISDVAVRVSGRICSSATQDARFRRTYRVFTRSVQPRPTSSGTKVTTPFLVTSRGLQVCFRSGEDCPEVVEPFGPSEEPPIVYRESIVDERPVKLIPSLLSREATRATRLPAMKELLRQIHHSMATSWRLPRRYPAGEVGFLDSDYFQRQIKQARSKEWLERRLADVADAPGELVTVVGGTRTVGEILDMDLVSLAGALRLTLPQAAELRRRLLGSRPFPAAGPDRGAASR